MAAASIVRCSGVSVTCTKTPGADATSAASAAASEAFQRHVGQPRTTAPPLDAAVTFCCQANGAGASEDALRLSAATAAQRARSLLWRT